MVWESFAAAPGCDACGVAFENFEMHASLYLLYFIIFCLICKWDGLEI